MMVSVFECYFRLLLHKSSMPEHVEEVNAKLEELLNWVTRIIFPASIQATAFCDLNVSKIAPAELSHISSNSSSTKADATDGNLLSRPKHLSLRFSHVSRPSVSFVQDGHSPLDVYVQSLAIGVIHLSSILCSEWLAIGGTDASRIALEATNWFVILDKMCSDSSDLGSTLLPSFGRLSIQLARASGNTAFLKALLDCSPPSLLSSDEGVIETVVLQMMSSRSVGSPKDSAVTRDVVSTVYEMVKVHVENRSLYAGQDAPLSPGKDPDDCHLGVESRCLRAALSSILNHGPSCNILAGFVENDIKLAKSENKDETDDSFLHRITKAVLLSGHASAGMKLSLRNATSAMDTDESIVPLEGGMDTQESSIVPLEGGMDVEIAATKPKDTPILEA
jgi:hypothetical protein